MNLIHHDIKNLNILVEDKKYSKFIDWNLAFFYYSGLETRMHAGTFGYFPPEILMSTSYVTPAADVWSFGITIYKHFARHLPHPIQMDIEGRN